MRNRTSPFPGRVAAFVLALALLLVTLPSAATAAPATERSPAAAWSDLLLDWLSGPPWAGTGRAAGSREPATGTPPSPDPVTLAAPLPAPRDTVTTTTSEEEDSETEAYPDTDPDG